MLGRDTCASWIRRCALRPHFPHRRPGLDLDWAKQSFPICQRMRLKPDALCQIWLARVFGPHQCAVLPKKLLEFERCLYLYDLGHLLAFPGWSRCTSSVSTLPFSFPRLWREPDNRQRARRLTLRDKFSRDLSHMFHGNSIYHSQAGSTLALNFVTSGDESPRKTQILSGVAKP
jgi:hypothetical protein